MKITTSTLALIALTASVLHATPASPAAPAAPAAPAPLGSPPQAPVNCVPVATGTAALVAKDKSKVLEIVSSQLAAHKACACEIVKTAIKVAKPDKKTVGAIVEAAILAAPDQMRIIVQCAIAAAPDAIAEIQAVLDRLAPGEDAADSAKSAKSAKDAKGGPEIAADALPNILDFPGFGPVGPLAGDPGGAWLLPIHMPIVMVPPPSVTQVDP